MIGTLWHYLNVFMSGIGWATAFAVLIGASRTRSLRQRREAGKSAIETTIRTTYDEKQWTPWMPIVVTIAGEKWLVDASRTDDGVMSFVWVQVGE